MYRFNMLLRAALASSLPSTLCLPVPPLNSAVGFSSSSTPEMGSDYEGVLGRMGSEAMIKRFALKFLQDPSFNNLKENLEKNDGEEAFRAAHTLKGVCLNLGFDELYEASAEITEKLRGKETAGSEDMFQKVEEKYQKTVNAIKGLE